MTCRQAQTYQQRARRLLLFHEVSRAESPQPQGCGTLHPAHPPSLPTALPQPVVWGVGHSWHRITVSWDMVRGAQIISYKTPTTSQEEIKEAYFLDLLVV